MSFTVRHAARAILLTPTQEVLLMRMAFPWRDDDLWILPGGGIEPGETAEDAVVREVLEETGATDIEIVGEAWYRETLVEATGTLLKQRYFLARTNRFQPSPADLSEAEMAWLKAFRWWTIDALQSERPNVEPIRIASALGALINGGLPERPIHVDQS